MFVRDNFGRPRQIPCGKCIDCRLEKSRQWAVRMIHESSMHENNCFITLTYNNRHLPKNGSVNKRHLQNFMKYLRKQHGDGIRFYACAEYGDKKQRPHYHICLFSFDFPDKKIIFEKSPKVWNNSYKAKDHYKLYTSKTLSDLWRKGFCTLGELTMETAAYTARYVVKKITGEKAKEHYKGKTPEFALMSRRPGIGKIWFDEYTTDVYPKDFFTINGVKHRPPRYYDSLLEKKDKKLLNKLKEDREKKIREDTSRRRSIKEKYKKIVTKQLKRGF